ncbi:hypothetical protein AMJ82_11005 [candidate division TA06 bacterium SM23_40]|uniref:Phage-like element PBSX protein XkdF domain-containing protein n=1 Tax=candidate division TA06 bacterium SM23_40 TaxID=1703774 RepID=A0A0S8G2H7_UNCT6|nr:MAG: hypothetical protein AMJ82_11005 [candidate division TA06 bacterium SM23_40]
MSPTPEYLSRFLAAARDNLPSWVYQQLHQQALPKAGGDASWRSPMISPLEKIALTMIADKAKGLSDDDLRAIRSALSRWSRQAGRRGDEIEGLAEAVETINGEAKRRGFVEKSEQVRELLSYAGADPTEIQTLIFDKDKFPTEASVRAWIKDHDFKLSPNPGIDETDSGWRVRQRDPGDFQEGSFRTIDITDGVKAVIGRLKQQKSEDDEDRSLVPILCAAPEKQIAYYLVARPGMMDTHGHQISREEIEKGCYGYMNSQKLKFEHGQPIDGRARLVENLLIPDDVKTFHGRRVEPGDWIAGIHYPDKALWKQVIDGDYGISWGGYAAKVIRD